MEAKDGISLETVFKANRSKSYKAQAGRSATHNFILGVPGEDLVFEVPVGVSLITELGKHLGQSLVYLQLFLLNSFFNVG